MKEYKAPRRLGLSSLYDIMEGRAITHYTVHREEVLHAAVKSAQTKEDMHNVITKGYKYFYGNSKPFITLDEFTVWMLDILADGLRGTESF